LNFESAENGLTATITSDDRSSLETLAGLNELLSPPLDCLDTINLDERLNSLDCLIDRAGDMITSEQGGDKIIKILISSNGSHGDSENGMEKCLILELNEDSELEGSEGCEQVIKIVRIGEGDVDECNGAVITEGCGDSMEGSLSKTGEGEIRSEIKLSDTGIDFTINSSDTGLIDCLIESADFESALGEGAYEYEVTEVENGVEFSVTSEDPNILEAAKGYIHELLTGCK